MTHQAPNDRNDMFVFVLLMESGKYTLSYEIIQSMIHPFKAALRLQGVRVNGLERQTVHEALVEAVDLGLARHSRENSLNVYWVNNELIKEYMLRAHSDLTAEELAFAKEAAKIAVANTFRPRVNGTKKLPAL
ncbi:hypothetical protein KW785_00215 [Candidatus Parcubacteria bacterium]|nr:hypothetical protein [Candidatus Parcubacteria bacterium]